MTNGTVVVLGTTGKNFGAGMTGGIAYVLDLDGKLNERINPQLVSLEPLTGEDTVVVRDLVEAHRKNTDSERAGEILDDWATFGAKFWKVAPHTPEAKSPELKAKTEDVITEDVTAAKV
jgi:glutamate synthase domain-containing protein 3